MIQGISVFCGGSFRRFLKLVAAALLAASAAASPTGAQGVMRIAAVVNEDVISAYDLSQRVRMVMVTGRIPDTPENRRRLAEQVLRNMIDEQLQLQEARRLNIRVTEEEIDRLLAKLNEQNKVPPGTLEAVLKRADIDINALRAKLRADDAWGKILREKLHQQVFISDEEVDEELKRLQAVQHLPRHRVAEIFLPVDSPDSERQVRELADRLMQQIRAGADFAALAREFSQSASAAVGGDLGWVTKGQLDAEIDKVIATTPERQVAGPVQTLAGYHILLVIDRVVPSQSGGEPLTLDYARLVLPVAQGSDGQQELQFAQQLRSEVETCDDLRAAAARLGTAKPEDVRGARVQDIPEAIRDRVASLEVGDTTEPVRTADGILVATLCARKGGSNLLPTREQIRNRLGNDRFNLLIQRYMRDLRRSAFVDIRG